ncbi:MAG TPA: hypothetical protein VKS21_04490, partial [Spirochaetota bacterium]|nr:hypothetical protein [Spirochaetota bacterium]
MKRFFAGMFIALLLAAPAFSSAKAGAKAEEDAVVNASVIKAEKSGPEENNKFLFFAEYNIGYAAAAGPKELSDNDTGVYDTPRFGAGAGLSIFMVDLYASASFLFFADRQDTSQHYTFIPLAAGVRIN